MLFRSVFPKMITQVRYSIASKVRYSIATHNNFLANISKKHNARYFVANILDVLVYIVLVDTVSVKSVFMDSFDILANATFILTVFQRNHTL